jgi:putative ABC transport system permease protein
VAIAATRTLAAMAASYLPRFDELRVDASVVLFAATTSLLTGVAFGMIPALRVTRVPPSAVLKEESRSGGGRRRRRTSGTLVIVECALAVVLLVGAGLLLRSLASVVGTDPGFTTDGVLDIRVALPRERRPTAAEARSTPNVDQVIAAERERTMSMLLQRITTIPGVDGAAYADDILLRGEADESITIPGRPDAPAGQLSSASVSPEFFGLLNVPLRSGRRLTRDDISIKIRALWGPLSDRRVSLAEQSRTTLAEPVVVNEAFVRRFFGGENPVGKRFCIDPTGKTYWYEIVGVVGDMRRQALEREPVAEYFQTFLPHLDAELLVRTRGDPFALAPQIRRFLSENLPGSIVLDVTSVDQRMGALTLQRRLQTSLLAVFAGLALLLAAIGIYGIVHYSVAERWRELGVRMALGASPSDVRADVIVRGMSMPIVGLAIGLVAAAMASRLMTSLVFGIPMNDPVTIAATVVVLAAVAFVACYLPARRAGRIDPMIALRAE